jgi:hypothetical protein
MIRALAVLLLLTVAAAAQQPDSAFVAKAVER